ncbi:MAG TPA: alpha/beta hydrolase [Acidimicrobiales bacterium]|nr:alpha/beta hydrolase [Acidimicrobiales bacterium]
MTERDEHQAVRLTDGRLLGFAEYGDATGTPVLCFHREVGSRLLARTLDHDARNRSLRLIAPDRPGFGFSDFQPDRAIADWPADVAELAGQLGLDRFAVLGVSAGTPYALACAWKLGNRVTSTVIAGTALPVSMMEDEPDTPPIQRLLTRSTVRAPWTIRPVMTLLAQVSRRAPEQAVSRMEASAGEADRSVFARPEVREMLVHSMAESFRSGPRGAAHDIRLVTADWGIPLGEVGGQVDVVHGGADNEVRPENARRLTDALPRARFHLVPGAGHHLTLTSPGQVLEPQT